MIKKTLAALSLGYSLWIWSLAASAGSAKNDDWAPVASVLFGLFGGVILLLIAIGSTILVLREQKSQPQSETDAKRSLAPTILFLNAGWIATALAVLKVAVMN